MPTVTLGDRLQQASVSRACQRFTFWIGQESCGRYTLATMAQSISLKYCRRRSTTFCRRSDIAEEYRRGPFKSGFGLSGAVLQLDRVFLRSFRVFVSSIPTRSPTVSHSRVTVTTAGPSTPQIIGRDDFGFI